MSLKFDVELDCTQHGKITVDLGDSLSGESFMERLQDYIEEFLQKDADRYFIEACSAFEEYVEKINRMLKREGIEGFYVSSVVDTKGNDDFAEIYFQAEYQGDSKADAPTLYRVFEKSGLRKAWFVSFISVASDCAYIDISSQYMVEEGLRSFFASLEDYLDRSNKAFIEKAVY